MNRARLVVSLLTLVCLSFSQSAFGKVSVGDKVAAGPMIDSRTGQTVSLQQLAGPKGVVLVFISTQCPFSNSFDKVMTDLAHEYKAKGVTLVGINSNQNEPIEAVKRHADERGLDFAVIKDQDGSIADELGATRTPEAFLLDKDMKVRYHGALGNSKVPSTDPALANANDLRPALDAVLSGGAVQVAETKAFGCTIKR